MMPTVNQLNAAFDSARSDITKLEATMPGWSVGYVEKYLTTKVILSIVRHALIAAEKVREAPVNPPR